MIASKRKKCIIGKVTSSYFSPFIWFVLCPFFLWVRSCQLLRQQLQWGCAFKVPCECLERQCSFCSSLGYARHQTWPEWMVFMPTVAGPRSLGLWAVLSLSQTRTEARSPVLPLQRLSRLECPSNLRGSQASFNYQPLHSLPVGSLSVPGVQAT